MCAAKRLNEVERRKEIMNSAAKVIVERGFEGTTMEEIIAGTTLSKGGVYHYYRNVVEIFRDIMILGIDYRNEIIKDHLSECKMGGEKEFMAKQLVDKILDENPYMPLYVEFLIAKKRNRELSDLIDRKSTRLNSSHANISYAVFCLKKKKKNINKSIKHFDNKRMRSLTHADLDECDVLTNI